jgi:hypothetical protein
MATNATPESYLPTGNPQEAVQEMPISDNNETKTEGVEEVTQPLSPQLAAVARQRRALQVKERELKERERALEAKSQGSDQITTARLKSDPLGVLQEAGVTYDQLTEAILAGQNNPEMRALKAELDALKSGIDTKFSERERQAEEQVKLEMAREASQIVAQGDEFELVRATESVPDVIRLIESVYRESGELLNVNEALKLVEDELFARNQKLLGLKKMQGLFAKQQAETQPQLRPQGMRTLTNKDTASVPMSAKQRALAAFYGTLKK